MKRSHFLSICLISSSVYSCNNPCSSCSTIIGTWIVNNCTNTYCRAKDTDCNNNCSICTADNLPIPCGIISTSSAACENLPVFFIQSICGSDVNNFNTQSGIIEMPSKITQLEVCEWYIDIRSSFSSEDNHYVDIKIVFKDANQNDMNIGNLTIWAYDVLSSDKTPNLNSLSPLKFQLQPDSLASMTSERLIKSNYLIIDYITGSSYSSYSGVHISWVAQTSSSSGGNNSQILTIVALTLSVFFTLACSIAVAWRIIRTIRRRDRVIDGARVVYPQNMGRAREYEVIPDDSAIILSEDNIERYMPKTKYAEGIVEIGECTCCVCFEEFKANIEVRKLLCRHVFHASCIEDWLVSQGGIPKCPLCKSNPFQPLFDGSNEVSRSENQEE